MTREEFVQQIRDTFKKMKDWKEEKTECWTLLIVPPAPKMVVNGREVEMLKPEPMTVKVEFVGEAEVDKIPGIQILFEVSQNKTILFEYEEIFFYDDYRKFVSILTSL